MADTQADLPPHLRNAQRWSSGRHRRPNSSTVVNSCNADLGVTGESMKLQSHTSKIKHTKSMSCTPAAVYGFLDSDNDNSCRSLTPAEPLHSARHHSTDRTVVEMKILQRCTTTTTTTTSGQKADKAQAKRHGNPPPKRNSGQVKDANTTNAARSDTLQLSPPALACGNETSPTDIQTIREMLLSAHHRHLSECRQQVEACEEDLGESVPPCSRWYELKSPEFHLEARRHAELVKKSLQWKKTLEGSGNFLHQLDSLLVLDSASHNTNTCAAARHKV